MENPEFTLEDTYGLLNDIKQEKQNEIDELTETIRNNKVSTLGPNVTIEEIVKKQQEVLKSLEKLVLKKPQNLPIQKSADLYSTAILGLQDEIHNMDALLRQMQNDLASLKSDVDYLGKKKSGFEKMKENALNATEDLNKTTYEQEYETAKRLFSEVKNDLKAVIETIYPENDELSSFLISLSRAQLKGGDDVYVKITQKTLSYTNFLSALGIITYHPNDMNKVKMMNFL